MRRKKNKFDKILYIGSGLTILFSVILVLYTMVSVLWPFEPVEYLNQPFPVLNPNKTVKPGDILEYNIKFCKHIDRPVNVYRELHDDHHIVSLVPIYSNFPTGCNDIVVDRTIIPYNIDPGEYELVLNVIMEMNPFKTHTSTVRTEKFTIE